MRTLHGNMNWKYENWSNGGIRKWRKKSYMDYLLNQIFSAMLISKKQRSFVKIPLTIGIETV